MAVVLDSTAAFLARLGALQVAQNAVDNLVTAGIDALGKLAFASSSQPDSGDDADLQDALTKALNRVALTARPLGALAPRLVRSARGPSGGSPLVGGEDRRRHPEEGARPAPSRPS